MPFVVRLRSVVEPAKEGIMDRTTILDMLRRTNDDLQRYVSEIPAGQLHWHEEGEWSAHETLAHVVDVERQVYLHRMQRVVEQDHPALKYFDEKAWHDAHYDPQRPVVEMLADFADARAQEIALLETQPDWSKWGLHEVLRKRYSLEFMAHYAFRHTWEHLNQIGGTQIAYELAHQEG
jgi:hypothetical protein